MQHLFHLLSNDQITKSDLLLTMIKLPLYNGLKASKTNEIVEFHQKTNQMCYQELVTWQKKNPKSKWEVINYFWLTRFFHYCDLASKVSEYHYFLADICSLLLPKQSRQELFSKIRKMKVFSNSLKEMIVESNEINVRLVISCLTLHQMITTAQSEKMKLLCSELFSLIFTPDYFLILRENFLKRKLLKKFYRLLNFGKKWKWIARRNQSNRKVIAQWRSIASANRKKKIQKLTEKFALLVLTFWRKRRIRAKRRLEAYANRLQIQIDEHEKLFLVGCIRFRSYIATWRDNVRRRKRVRLLTQLTQAMWQQKFLEQTRGDNIRFERCLFSFFLMVCKHVLASFLLKTDTRSNDAYAISATKYTNQLSELCSDTLNIEEMRLACVDVVKSDFLAKHNTILNHIL